LNEFKLGWKPLSAALVGVMCGASPLPFNVLPLVMGPIHAETGWDFKTISAGITVFGVIAALSAPYVGGLADRRGVRPVALISLLAFGLVFATMWFVPATLGAWFTFWGVVGLVGIGSTPVTFSRAIAMWFAQSRGLALGIMLLGTSFAGLLVPQIANRAIETGGWRLVFPVIALMPLLVALPFGFALFREPRPDERPVGINDGEGSVAGVTLGQAMRGYRFWVLFGSILIIALAYGGAHIHMVQIVQLHGFTPKTAASVMGIVALGILAGRVIVGMLFDRLWAPGIAFPVLLMPALACAMLMGTSGSLGVIMAGGFMLGFAAGAESDVIAYLAARYFGMAHYGRIYGWLYLPFGIGSAISPILYGASRDMTGSYDTMLMVAMFMFAGGGAALLTLGRYPGKAQLGEART
jgi:MFS family permease